MKTNVGTLRRLKNKIVYFRFSDFYDNKQKIVIENGMNRGIDVSRYMYPWLPHDKMSIIYSKLMDELYERKKLTIFLITSWDNNAYVDTDSNRRINLMGSTSYSREVYKDILNSFDVYDDDNECCIYIKIFDF